MSRVSGKAALITIYLFSIGCALPPDTPSQHFVPRKDLRAISTAREGIFYLSQNRFIDAELKLAQALYLEPDAANLKLNLESALEGQGHLDEAEAILAPFVESTPDDPDVLFRLAHLRVAQNKFNEAR